jgi:hypothetical protein
MKIFALLSGFYLLAALAYGQVRDIKDFSKTEAMLANFGGTEFRTNAVSRVEAIRVVSQLRVGVWEENASQILSTNNLKHPLGIATITGWDRCYGLADGTCLHLGYRARKLAKDGNWGGNGELQRAFIHSKEVTVVFITLTNAP